MVCWEHFAHGADMGIRGRGPTLASAFEQSALAMMAVITNIESIMPRECVTIACEAPEPDLLLVEWLNALVYEMATRRMLFGRFSVHVKDCRLSAQAWGEPVDVERHQPAVEVKGVTYTALEVSRRDDGDWITQCVVDV